MEAMQAQVVSSEVEALFRKGAITPAPAKLSRFCQPDLSGIEVRRLMETSHQPQRTQQVHNDSSLQDGVCQNLEGAGSDERLDGQAGLKGRLPYCPNPPRPPTIPEVCMERSDVAVQVPAIWSEHCPLDVHKADEARSSQSEEAK